jgi:D-glycero-alpha-D-manno-heptose 1-phosphate guanylyltransferase
MWLGGERPIQGSSLMEAIVLAGGFGTRLRGVVSDVPKPMAPVAGKPFLEILLRALASKGFGRVVLSLGFMADKISGYFGDQFAGMELTYVVEDHPLGTGGAVRLALANCQEDHVFVFNGDTFLDLEVDEVERLWQERYNPIIVGRIVPDTARYGCLLTEHGRVTGFSEKGVAGPGLINAGCFVLDRSELNGFALHHAFSLETDFLANAVQRIPVDVFVTEGLFIDIGIPEDYARAQTLLAGAA